LPFSVFVYFFGLLVSPIGGADEAVSARQVSAVHAQEYGGSSAAAAAAAAAADLLITNNNPFPPSSR
jgi:hypothetical protein